MRKCKLKIKNYCEHYKKNNPPINFCHNSCKFFVPGTDDEEDLTMSFCERHQMPDNPTWCYFYYEKKQRWINNQTCEGSCDEKIENER